MDTKRKTPLLAWLIPAVLLFAAGFTAAALYDLPLDQALYSPGNLYAIIFEGFGWYPVYLPTLLLCAVLLTANSGKLKIWQFCAAALVFVGGFTGIAHSSFGTLVQRGLLSGLTDIRIWFWFAAALLLVVAMLTLCQRASASTRLRLLCFSVWGSVFMLANHVVIKALKMLWQRTRFDDMMAAGSFEAFTPWYHIMGNGGSSFPSGHTANAVSILLLIVLCDLFAVRGAKRVAAYAVSWGYIGAMAFARILIGRHYLSDTLAAAGIMAILFFVMRRLPLYKRSLQKVQQTLEKTEKTR